MNRRSRRAIHPRALVHRVEDAGSANPGVPGLALARDREVEGRAPELERVAESGRVGSGELRRENLVRDQGMD